MTDNSQTIATSRVSDRLYFVLVTGYFCIALGLNNGFILGGLTAFDMGFLERLDISVSQLKVRDSITLGIVGVFALATGALVDKIGIFRVLITGHALLALAFWLLSQAGSIEAIYGAQAILGICQLFSGYLVCIMAVSRYLPFGSGLAIGLMMAATSLGNALLPSVNVWAIEAFGATGALQLTALAAVPLILGALAVQWAGPRGAEPAKDTPKVAAGPTLLEALKRLDFWAIILVAVFSFFGFMGVVTNIAVLASSAPFNDISAAGTFFFALFIVSLFAQVAAGWIADRISLRGVHMAGLLIMAVALGGLSASGDISTATLFFAVLGLGWGFNYVFIQVAIPKRFGGQSLGKIFGAIVLAEAASGAAGPVVFGAVFDGAQSYSPILITSAAMLLVAMGAAAVLHRR